MFYIETKPENGEIKRFVMDIETDISLSMPGNPTVYRVDGGYDASDHYHQPFDKLTVNGIVSAAKFTTSARTSSDLVDFETGLRQLKTSGQLFKCSFSDNLEVYQNCLFSELNFARNTQHGPYSLVVSMRIQNIRQAQQAQLTAFPRTDSDYETLQAGKTSGKSNTVVAKKNKILDDSLNLLQGKGLSL